MAENDSPISAELSKMIRDRRVAKRREGWETAGRVAGGIGDVITGGEVSRAKRAWTPFQDKPLTTREKITVTQAVLDRREAKKRAIAALKQGNMQAAQKALDDAYASEQKLNNLEYTERSKLAGKDKEADSKIEQLLVKRQVDIQALQTGVVDDAAATRIINEYQTSGGLPTEGDGRIAYIEGIAEKLLTLDPLTSSHILTKLDPEIVRHIQDPQQAYNEDAVGQLQRKLTLGEMDAAELQLEGQMVQRQIDKKVQDRARRGARLKRAKGGGTPGVSGGYESRSSQDVGVGADGAGGDDSGLTNELLGYRDFQPDTRKESARLDDQMLANPELAGLARDQGVDLSNSVQAAHFMKQLDKAQKLAEKTYAKSKRRGVDPRELLAKKAKRARWWASLFGGGAGAEDGQRSSRQMRVQLAQVLQGISPEHMDTYLQKHRKNKAQEIDRGLLEDSDTTEETPAIVEPTEEIPLSEALGQADELDQNTKNYNRSYSDRLAEREEASAAAEVPEMVWPEREIKSDSDFTQALRASRRRTSQLGSVIKDELATVPQ